MKKKAFIPVSALMGVLLLTLVATMTLFVAEPDIAYAQESADADLATLAVVGAPSGTVYTDGDLDPNFSLSITEYTVRTNFNDSGVTVTATAVDAAAGATVRVNGQTPNDINQVGVTIPDGVTTNISIVVTAAAGNTKTYTVKAYRNRSILKLDADLSSLNISPSGGLTLSSDSTPIAPIYEARVQADKVTVSYRLSDTGGGAFAVVTAGTGTSIADSTKPNEVTLGDEGETSTFTVVVTPESGGDDGKTYTINVYHIRDNRSTDAKLDESAGLGLTPSTGNIGGYTYSQDNFMYDLTVANNVEYVTLNPDPMDNGATFVINPRTDARPGVDNHQVNLRAGVDTPITVTVTAEDPEATQIYKLTIYKRRSDTATNPDINDTTLRALSIRPETFTPAFSSSEKGYSAQIASDVEKVTVSYTPTNNLGGVTVEVTASDNNNTNLIVSDDNEVTLGMEGTTSTIRLNVTAEDGQTSTAATGDNVDYTIAIYRLRALPSANAALNIWTINGNPVPGFTAGALSTEAHSMTVLSGTPSVIVVATPTAETAGATVEITPASPVALTAGAPTTITVTVTAEDRMTTAEYTVVVYRQREDLSEDATLSVLSLMDSDENMVTLAPTFLSDRTEYNARVGGDVDKVTVSYTPTDNAGGASVAVSSAATADAVDNGCEADAGDDVTLGSPGSEIIVSLCVTPEAGVGQNNTNLEVYEITVYRENTNRNIDATLSPADGQGFAIIDDNPSGVVYTEDNDEVTASVYRGGQIDHDGGQRDYWNLEDGGVEDVHYRVRSVIVSAMPTDSAGAVATIVSPPDNDPATADHEINLTAGETTEIEVLVTAEDTSVTRTYTASVYRQNLNLSDDATLSSLMLSDVVLTPEFASGTIEYTANVPYSTMQTTVTAMATHLGAQSGIAITPSDENVDLDPGENTITITVTAEDGTAPEGYTIKVTRADALSDDASLSSLRLSDIELDSVFDPATMAYTATVANVEATTVEAMATDPSATIMGDGEMSLMVGENTVEVMVTAEDGTTTETYTVTVTVLSSDATLASLTLSGLTLDPEFDSATMAYTATVDASVEATTVEAMATDPSATIMGDGEMSLMVGENTVEVMVTAEDGTTTETYTVTVTVLSSDATLASLDLSDITLDPEFDSATTMYTATVDASVEATTVEAMATDPSATIMGDGEMSLMVGENTVEVMVTAEDGTTMMTYTVTVTVEMPTLLDRYDEDDSGDIDLDEVSAAIDDYFNDQLTLAEVNTVIDLYFE